MSIVGGDIDNSRLARRLWDEYVLVRRVNYQSHAKNRLSTSGRRGMWRRWNRENAILSQMPMVERIARDVRSRVFIKLRGLDIADMIATGNLALAKAGHTYHPSKGDFERYSYFVVRGAIIDAYKRRAYREEQNESLQAIASAYDGWLPANLDTDRKPRHDEVLASVDLSWEMESALALLRLHGTDHDRAFAMHVEGHKPSQISLAMGIPVSGARMLVKEARQFLAHRLRANESGSHDTRTARTGTSRVQ